MYGDTTTWNVWLPMDHSAADEDDHRQRLARQQAGQRDEARADARRGTPPGARTGPMPR